MQSGGRFAALGREGSLTQGGGRIVTGRTNLKMDHTSTANARPVRSREEKGITDFNPSRAVAGAVALKLVFDMEMARRHDGNGRE
jgi:hypothetical protein